MKRRGFIRKSSLGTLMMALHPTSCFVANNKTENPESKDNSIPFDLIKNIRLLTQVALHEMKTFYVEKMGFSIIEERSNEVTFLAGRSTITFVKVEADLEDPWYHFAFNIPENKILKAREWQLKRTTLVPTPQRLRDVNFPDDVRHFSNWNAHSIFFWDPAGNLLEFIARHDLNNGATGDFSTKDILNVSEIAFVVDDQQKEAKAIAAALGLSVYPKSSNFWWSMGDENGLVLCIPKRVFGENTTSPKTFGVHKTEATLNSDLKKEYDFEGFPYKIMMEKM